MRIYKVRNQYGVSVRLKFFRWNFTLFKFANNAHKIKNSVFFNTLNNRTEIILALREVTDKYEVKSSFNEVTIKMMFAKDVVREIKKYTPVDIRIEAVEVGFLESLKLKGTWDNGQL